ncbi:hypothetical protein HEB94_006314 [Actinopolymorpha pittospori]|uniref:Uncharacterized protein n=1 Tax=Actinopolymorpha pittospori TaxID=648752 RepID=A0A927RLR4_9ACTN|nr:hypothetical protein [Actinopolymorpha pittospori]
MPMPPRPRPTPRGTGRPARRRGGLLSRLRRGRLRMPPGGGSGGPPDQGPPEAGVREPRRPRSGPPAMAAEADEPRDKFLDVTSDDRA